jgi:hypothetical protein
MINAIVSQIQRENNGGKFFVGRTGRLKISLALD